VIFWVSWTLIVTGSNCGEQVTLMCGLRMGESLGLRWSDIDLEAGTLRVHRQLQRVREGGGLVFSEPKNASRRTIDLPQRALEALRSHRECDGRGIGKATAALLLPSPRISNWGLFSFYGFCRKIR
jgi:integrase